MRKKATKKSGRWMQKARESMEKRGTVGTFGKATAKKIARGKKEGGLQKKRAVEAENFKKAAQRRKKKGRSSGRR